MSKIATQTAIAPRYDETRALDGTLLPGWSTVLGWLEAKESVEHDSSRYEIARQLRGNGLAYDRLGEADESTRSRQLDLLPMIVEYHDWQALQDGLIQRARLKKAMLSDLYGDQKLLSEGIIPPQLVYAHSGYMREAKGLWEFDQLPTLGIDVARASNGQWYVVNDDCQYARGLGYTLENRLILSRAHPQLFRECRVSRIAPYFRALQQCIIETMDRDSLCVMLSYSTSHPNYFEYAWLARYLGYMLVESGDLVIRDECVFLRTVDGLKRVHVILRFVKDIDIDPLTVNNRSGAGIPGILQAVRTGNVTILNPLGSGILGNPAFNAYTPALCQHLLGEELLLFNAKTWWLGDAEQQADAMSRLDDLLIREIDGNNRVRDPRLLSSVERESLVEAIETVPARYIAEERLGRSIVPSLESGSRIYREATLRSFLVKHDDDFSVMTGGLCRLDDCGSGFSTDGLALTKDVWVLSDTPVVADTLLRARSEEIDFALSKSELPSRVAENLFWLGRNAERCESSLRLLRAICLALRSDDSPVDSTATSKSVAALLRSLTAATGSFPGFVGKGGSRRIKHPDRELLSLLQDTSRSGSLPFRLLQLQRSASTVRDRVSQELLRALNRLDDESKKLQALPRWRQLTDNPDALNRTIEQLNEVLLSLSAFSGLIHENLTHGTGWHFLSLGRRLERARQTSLIQQVMLNCARDDVVILEQVLILFDSIMTYRSRYRSQIDARLVAELVVLDETNPRSIAYQFRRIDELIQQLPGIQQVGVRDPLLKTAIAGISQIRLFDAEYLVRKEYSQQQTLSKFLGELQLLPEKISTKLTARYFTHVDMHRNIGDTDTDQPGQSE